MADFTVNLAAPQGAGAQMIQPVQEQVIPSSGAGFKLLEGVADIFAKGLVADTKAKALERKNAVIGEYVKNEAVYSDAMVTGQWNASQVGAASRANFQKMQASYPEYITELLEARKGVYDGTETGEAQRKIDAELKFKLQEKERASQAGYTFFEGMSPETEAKNIAANQTTIRINAETEQAYKRNAEERAQRADTRAGESHVNAMQDHLDKENAVKGLLEIADRNFDSVWAVGKDLMANQTMPFEQKQLVFGENLRRIRTGMLAVAAKNPEMAAPWQKLTDEMETTFNKLADPKLKDATELERLKTEWETQQYKAKLFLTQDPKVARFAALNQMFSNNPGVLAVESTPIVRGILAQIGEGGDVARSAPAVVGTPGEKAALKSIKTALGSLQDGSLKGDKEKLGKEAVNTVNEVIRQTGMMDKGIPADQLKDLSSFYASAEFGKLSAEGKIDMASMQNAKRVFQVAYEPTVQRAIDDRLKTASVAGRVTFTMDGGNVVIKKAAPSDKRSLPQMMAGALDIGAGIQGNRDTADVAAIRDAQAGLNTLIKLGAHMEGTTDYAKFWENNKHYMLPAVFPDPARLKPGQVVNGRKYLGGDYSDRSNWAEVK